MIEAVAHVGWVWAVVVFFVWHDVGELGSDVVVEVAGLVVGEDVGDEEALEEELLRVGEGFNARGHCFWFDEDILC